jgi:hypothetical protein
MDVNNLLNELNGLDDRDLDVRLYFTTKKTNGSYTSYSPAVGNGLHKELKDLMIEALEPVEEVEQREFNPIGTIEGYVETYRTHDVNSFNDILRSMDEEVVVRRDITKAEISKLTFYCLRIGLGENGDVLFFRRVTKFNNLEKKGGFVGVFSSGDFEKLDDALLGIDPNVDIVVYGNEILILNHISLERIFSINDQYQEKAGQTLDLVQHASRINNFDQFREDCLNDRRITRALTKILNEQDRVHQVFENFDNVIQVIDIFELNIELEEENTKILYEDKSQLMDITRLIRDSFYRSIINNRQGVDEGV